VLPTLVRGHEQAKLGEFSGSNGMGLPMLRAQREGQIGISLRQKKGDVPLPLASRTPKERLTLSRRKRKQGGQEVIVWGLEEVPGDLEESTPAI